MTTDSVRTIIVDDHALVTAGLAALLPERSGGRLEVVATETDASQAGRVAEESRASLAVVDLRMPPPGGVEAIRDIAARVPRCRIVAVSGEADRDTILEALLAGAVAFLPKTIDPVDLVHPLLTILAGGSVVPPALLRDLADAQRERQHLGDAPELNDGQLRLLSLLVGGHETTVIADRLFVSPSTVKRHLSALEDLLEASSRVQLAYTAGWHRLVLPAEETDTSTDETPTD